jgi:hypothetical protein
MAMPTAVYKDADKKRVLPKKGYHHARLKGIFDIGTVKATDPTYSDRRMFVWLWELVNLSKEKKGKNPAQSVFVPQTLPYNGKSKNLVKILNDWLGILPAEMLRKDFDIVKELLDQPAEVLIVHSKDGKYANIAKDNGINAVKGKVKAGVMKAQSFDMTSGEPLDMDEFKKIPMWIQNKIIDSDEFIEISGERSSSRRSSRNESASANKKVAAKKTTRGKR